MLPLLIDEGLPWQVATAFRELGLKVRAVGEEGAPPRESSDEVNVKWCKAHSAVLVTNDHGKKDRIILNLLAEHHVHAVFVPSSLRAGPAHNLARALLHAEGGLETLASRRSGLIRHRLRPGGGLERR